jgi:hypothetical protein
MRDGSRQTNKSGRDGERLGRGSERSRGEVWGGSGCCREVKREKRSCTNVKVTKTRQINTSNQTGDTEAKARETALAAWRCFSFSLFFFIHILAHIGYRFGCSRLDKQSRAHSRSCEIQAQVEFFALQTCNVHQSITERDDDYEAHQTRWNTTGEEMADLEVTLACLRDFGHDGS